MEWITGNDPLGANYLALDEEDMKIAEKIIKESINDEQQNEGESGRA